MEFDDGDENWRIFTTQRDKNWWREGYIKKKKKALYLCFETLIYFLFFVPPHPLLLSVKRLGNGVVSHLIDVALIIVIILKREKRKKNAL